MVKCPFGHRRFFNNIVNADPLKPVRENFAKRDVQDLVVRFLKIAFF
jgi:hypothetical protein